jgi:hypothetical protein
MRRNLGMSVVHPNLPHLPLAVLAFVESVVGRLRAEIISGLGLQKFRVVTGRVPC